MLRTVLFVVLLLKLLHGIDAGQKVLRRYVAIKDMVSGEKASQFSFYADKSEKNLTHRIESYYSPMQKIDLRTYPHDEIVARLDAQQLGSYYTARFELKELRNTTNNVWYTGLIKRGSAWFQDKYLIHLAERTITMPKNALNGSCRHASVCIVFID